MGVCSVRHARTGRCRPRRCTVTAAQSCFDAGLRTAVRALEVHVPDEQRRCVACGTSWPCGPAVTAEHNVELLHPQTGRPAE